MVSKTPVGDMAYDYISYFLFVLRLSRKYSNKWVLYESVGLIRYRSYFQGITLNLSATRMLGMNKSMMLVCKKAFQYILKWLRTANHLKISEVLIQLGLNNNRMVRLKKP